jgi:hypothetical protein
MRFSGLVKPIGGGGFKPREVTTGKATVWNAYDVEVLQGKADTASDKALPLTETMLLPPDTRHDRIFTRYNQYLENDPAAAIALKVNTYVEIINKYQYDRPVDNSDDITAIECWKKKLLLDYSVPGTSEIVDMILTTGEIDIVKPSTFGARQIITSDSSLLRFSPKKDTQGRTLEDNNLFVSSQMISFIDVKTVYQDLLCWYDKKSELANSLSTFHGMIGKEVMGVQFAGKLQKSLYQGNPSIALSLTDLHPLWFKRTNEGPIDSVSDGAELSNDLEEAEDY